MNKQSNCVMVIVNAVSNLVNFRHELILELINKGYGVIIVSPSGLELSTYEKLGCKIIIQPVNRHGQNVFQDMMLMEAVLCSHIYHQAQFIWWFCFALASGAIFN